MIKALKGIETAFVMIFMAISCNDVDSFMFENAEQVAGFPVSVSLQNPDTVRLDAIGIQGIKVLDDCILVSAADSTGCILAYEKQDFSRRGHGFINVGRGPGEVLVNREGNNFIFFHGKVNRWPGWSCRTGPCLSILM